MKFASILLLALGLSASAATFAQSAPWPSKPIRIITPTPAGVGSDVFARFYADKLSKALNTPIVVENRPGALSTIGTDAVAKAAPDGYTILFSTSNPFTMTPFLLSKIPYNAQTDLLPVTQALKGGSFVVATKNFPANNLAELIAMAKKEPGKITFASYGPGSTAHLGMELIQEAAGIELVHVPYKQGAVTDVIGGQVMLGFEPPISALPNIALGRLKPIAYTGAKRNPALPDVPAVSESLPGVEVFTWIGFWVPAKTPPEIIERLNKEINALTRSPEMVKLITDAGLDPVTSSSAEMAATIERESLAMGKLIKAKGLRLD